IECLAIAIEAVWFCTLSTNSAEPVRTVNLLDSRHGRHFESVSARMFEEAQRTCSDHGVIGNPLRSFQVAFEIGIVDKLYVAEIGKPFAAHGVAGEILIELQLQSGQVGNRVGVLAAGETPHRDAARGAVV